MLAIFVHGENVCAICKTNNSNKLRLLLEVAAFPPAWGRFFRSGRSFFERATVFFAG
jgi:hypothetical protein